MRGGSLTGLACSRRGSPHLARPSPGNTTALPRIAALRTFAAVWLVRYRLSKEAARLVDQRLERAYWRVSDARAEMASSDFESVVVQTRLCE